ncbi:MAG: AAA family ATPase [Ignavibacteriales bacterium]
MQYNKFIIKNYRAIKGPLEIDLKNKIIPLVGINECGKTTILQAIFAFDRGNDYLNSGKQVNDISNLYALEDEPCEIKAVIDLKKAELIALISGLIKIDEDNKLKNDGRKQELEEDSVEWKKIDKQNQIIEREIDIYRDTIEKVEAKIPEEDIQLELIRLLSDNEDDTYVINHKVLNKIEDYELIEERITNQLINFLPPILYSDDFNDRPAGSVVLTEKGDSTEWERIYSRVFNNALRKSDFSIYSLYDEDNRRRKSILSDVSKYLSDNLTDAWSRFSNEKKKITISFDLEEQKENNKVQRLLQINIVEDVNGQERIFGISDRSKGFIWYYNFIMKIQFNPKQNSKDNTIFLLDEPGSYLHETAQNELCKKLVEISKGEGVVIYCTHSPQLLNPAYIPLNTINIVSKNKSKVACSSISETKTISTKTTAFQPIYEALQIPEFKFIDKDKKIVAVEGIYDKYALELFSEAKSNVIFFASANAKSIRDNIQYFIAFNIDYMAIWDNDGAGDTHLNTAKKEFGEFESKNFFKLPDLHNKGIVRMEEMFEQSDMELINATLGLDKNTSYTITMGTLYYSSSREKQLKEIKSKLSKNSSNSFSRLNAMIKEHFNN